MRLSAEPFADGIPPKVRCHFFDGVRRAKDVVVIAHFPEALAVKPLKFKGSALLEQPNKFAKVRVSIGAFGENVYVVRHDAIRKEKKRMAGRAFDREMKNFLSVWRNGEMGSATVTTNGDEINLAADVVFCGKARILAMKRHCQNSEKERV